MKRFFYSLLALLVLTTGISHSAQQPIDAQDFVFENILLNPGFENGVGGWTASGGATATANSTAKGWGTYGYNWDSNSASQTLQSSSITIPAGLYGKNGHAYCQIKTPSGTATHTITVNDGTNDIVTAQTITSSSSTFALAGVTFPFPTSGTIRLKITAVASNEPEIYIDGCYLGRNANIAPANVMTDWVTFTPTGGWSGANVTYTGRYRRVGDVLEAQVHIALSGAPTGTTLSINLPGICVADTTKIPNASGEKVLGLARIFDTGTKGYDGIVAYSSTTAVNVYAASGASPPDYAQVSATAPFTFGNTDGVNVNFSVPCVGWTNETAYRPEAIGWRVDANISGANPSLSLASVSSYTGIENGSLTLTNNTGPGVLTAQIPCSSTNAPSGTTCSAGNESVGVSFTMPAAGSVLACASFTHRLTNSGSSEVHAAFQIVETATNSQTILQEGRSRIQAGNDAFSRIQSTPLRVCGTFYLTAGAKALRLMYEQAVTGTPTTNAILADADASNGQRDVHWEVYPINQPMPAPLLVGSVTSNSTGLERVERARVTCSNSASAISSQSGSWISSPSNGATAGECSFTITGFTSAPTCNCTVESSATDRVFGCNITSVSTSTISLNTSNSTTPTGSNELASVTCQGPR